MSNESIRRRRARRRGHQDVIRYLNLKADRAAKIRPNSAEVRELRGLVAELVKNVEWIKEVPGAAEGCGVYPRKPPIDVPGVWRNGMIHSVDGSPLDE